MEDLKTVRMGEHSLRFEDDPDPGDWFLEKARKELRETPETKEEGLKQLKDLLSKMDDIHFPIDDDEALLPYLRVCHFYPQSAFNKIINYLTFKLKNPKYTHNITPVVEKNVFKHNIFTVLPYRDQNGRRILVIEAGKKWIPKEVSLVEIVRGVIMVVHAALMEPRTQISGSNIIIDLEGLSLTHVWQFSPGFARMLVGWVQECLPCRVKAIHIVNQPYVFNMLFAVFKPFLGEKLRNRIHFHGENKASLMEYFDPKCIPTQYGGDMILNTEYGMNLNEVMCQYTQKIDGNLTFLINGNINNFQR